MKCVKNSISGEIKRVADYEAARLMAYGWVYVPKGEWKAANRLRVRASESAKLASTFKRRA